jgi:hypothetical protein
MNRKLIQTTVAPLLGRNLYIKVDLVHSIQSSSPCCVIHLECGNDSMVGTRFRHRESWSLLNPDSEQEATNGLAVLVNAMQAHLLANKINA